MKGTEATHVIGVLAVAISIRYILFPFVGVWGDAGFYTYDALLINSGQTPFVDFIGRSPLFVYSYAVVASVFGNGIETLRWFIAFWWLLAAVPVYYIARELHSHVAGLAAMAVLELSPFMLVYGYWANTQSLAAVLSISAIAALVWRQRLSTYLLAGALFGLAFLSRRSVITIMGGVAIWMGYTAVRYHREDLIAALSRRVVRGVGFLAAFGAVLFGMYGWMAHGNLELTIAFAETHAWGLISSSGRGGFPLITDLPTPNMTGQISKGRIPIFNDLCQRCGAWTARTFAKTTLVSLPVVAPLLVYFRDWSDRLFSDRTRDYTFGTLLALAGYGVVVALIAGYWLRPLAVVSLVVFAILVFEIPPIDPNILYDRRMLLVVFSLALLAMGYLYRNRVLHTYYFSDFMPLLAVVIGVIYTEIWAVIDDA